MLFNIERAQMNKKQKTSITKATTTTVKPTTVHIDKTKKKDKQQQLYIVNGFSAEIYSKNMCGSYSHIFFYFFFAALNLQAIKVNKI